MLDRRDLLRGLGAAGTCCVIPSCSVSSPTYLDNWTPIIKTPIIDFHAHVFNASDLPIYGFLRRSVFGIYDEQEFPNGGSIEIPKECQCKDTGAGVLKRSVAEILAVIVRDIMVAGSVTAADELRELNGGGVESLSAKPSVKSAIKSSLDRLYADDQITTESVDEPFPWMAAAVPNRAVRANIRRNLKEGRSDYQSQLRDELKVPALDLSKNTDRDLAAKKLASDDPFEPCGSKGLIGRYLCWAHKLTLRRRELCATIEKQYSGPGTRINLFVNHVIDYSRWLDDAPASPVDDQIAVMTKLSRRSASTGAKFHSFVPFCPIVDIETNGGSLARVKDAMEGKGFLGAKIYPPMGYLPFNNAQYKCLTLPKRFAKYGPLSELPARIDDALNGLYAWAQSANVPIMTHALNSQGAGPCFSERANPKYWRDVFNHENFPKLTVCMAHFGSFQSAIGSSGFVDLTKVMETWEWTMGELIQKQVESGSGGVYADISYFSEILSEQDTSPVFRSFQAAFVKVVSAFPALKSRLIYGSDWILMEREANSQFHLKTTLRFLTNAGFSEDEIGMVFGGAAVRLLGLRKGDSNRARLQAFYADTPGGSDWLTAFDLEKWK